MKLLMIIASIFFCVSAFAKSSSVEIRTFIDRVYQINKIQERMVVSFDREAVLYEVTTQEKSLLQKLEQSQKKKKPVAVTVNPLTKHILKVKGP